MKTLSRLDTLASELLTIDEVAILRNRSRPAVDRWIKEQGLKHVTDAFGRVLIERRDALAFEPRPQGFPKGRKRTKKKA